MGRLALEWDTLAQTNGNPHLGGEGGGRGGGGGAVFALVSLVDWNLIDWLLIDFCTFDASEMLLPAPPEDTSDTWLDLISAQVTYNEQQRVKPGTE